MFGGVPARKLGTIHSFGEHYRDYAVDMRKVNTNRKEYIEKCRKIQK